MDDGNVSNHKRLYDLTVESHQLREERISTFREFTELGLKCQSLLKRGRELQDREDQVNHRIKEFAEARLNPASLYGVPQTPRSNGNYAHAPGKPEYLHLLEQSNRTLNSEVPPATPCTYAPFPQTPRSNGNYAHALNKTEYLQLHGQSNHAHHSEVLPAPSCTYAPPSYAFHSAEPTPGNSNFSQWPDHGNNFYGQPYFDCSGQSFQCVEPNALYAAGTEMNDNDTTATSGLRQGVTTFGLDLHTESAMFASATMFGSSSAFSQVAQADVEQSRKRSYSRAQTSASIETDSLIKKGSKKRLAVITLVEARQILDAMLDKRDDDGKFVCPSCSRGFKCERAKVKRHLTQHLACEYMPYACHMCHTQSMAKEDIRRHVIDVHKVEFTKAMEVQCVDTAKERVIKNL